MGVRGGGAGQGRAGQAGWRFLRKNLQASPPSSPAGSGHSAQAASPARPVSYAIHQKVPSGHAQRFANCSWFFFYSLLDPMSLNFGLFFIQQWFCCCCWFVFSLLKRLSKVLCYCLRAKYLVFVFEHTPYAHPRASLPRCFTCSCVAVGQHVPGGSSGPKASREDQVMGR